MNSPRFPVTSFPPTAPPGRRVSRRPICQWDAGISPPRGVTFNIVPWQARGIEYVNIESVCANGASGLFKFGCPTYELRSSSRNLTASRLSSRSASMKPTTRRSSTPSPSIGTTRRSPPSEARRHLHRSCTWRLYRQAEARCHRPGRPVRCNRLRYGLSADYQSGRGAIDADRCRADGHHRNRASKSHHGRQDCNDAARKCAQSSGPTRRFRYYSAQPRTLGVSRACRVTSSPCTR